MMADISKNHFDKHGHGEGLQTSSKNVARNVAGEVYPDYANEGETLRQKHLLRRQAEIAGIIAIGDCENEVRTIAAHLNGFYTQLEGEQ